MQRIEQAVASSSCGQLQQQLLLVLVLLRIASVLDTGSRSLRFDSINLHKQCSIHNVLETQHDCSVGDIHAEQYSWTVWHQMTSLVSFHRCGRSKLGCSKA
jgi:hypothetical protein